MSSNQLEKHNLQGTPALGLATATLAFAAGLTTIVFYGVAGPAFKESLGLSSAMLGVLLSSPHLSKVLLRIVFGASVDQVGGRKPLLLLLTMSLLGIGGLVVLLFTRYPDRFDPSLYPLLLVFGVLAGAGGATFSVSVPMASFWYPSTRQGFSLGVVAGVGNISPGVINFVIPVAIVAWSLPYAYLAWFVVILVATLIFATFGTDAYYFQLRRSGVGDAAAREIASAAGQDVFPNGSGRDSLIQSARNPKTWVLVLLYTVSFGGGFTALATWFPTYFYLYHELSLATAGLLAGAFTVYGSLIRVPGGMLCDRWSGESVIVAGFVAMTLGGAILSASATVAPACVGMFVLGTGMGLANAGVFALVPRYVPDAVGGASGWIGGVGGAGTLLVLPLLGVFVDRMGQIGYARGFLLFVGLSALCLAVALWLKRASKRALR